MKKMKLNLEQLKVESFEIKKIKYTKGTIIGNGADDDNTIHSCLTQLEPTLPGCANDSNPDFCTQYPEYCF